MKLQKAITGLYLIWVVSTQHCLGQNTIAIRKASLNPIQFVDALERIGKEIYCAGITYEIEKRDGYATYAYLKKFDSNLKPEWTIRIDSASKKNGISNVARYNDKLYALVTQGVNTNTTTDLSVSLYIISMEGRILKKIPIGKSLSRTTNIHFHGNEVWFAYSEPSTIYYASNTLIPVAVKYDLKSGAIKKFKGATQDAYPEAIITDKSGIYVVGKRTFRAPGKLLNEQELFLMSLENDRVSETIITASVKEYFMDCYLEDDRIVILGQFPGNYEDRSEYLRIHYFDTVAKKQWNKTIPFRDVRCDEISFTNYSTGRSTWLKIKEEGEAFSFIEIDFQGEIKNREDVEGDYTGVGKFVIGEERLYEVDNNIILESR